MNQIVPNENKESSAEFEFSDDVKNIFVEGFGPMLVGYPFTKVSLMRQKIPGQVNNKADKELIGTLTVSTAALLELADNIRQTLKKNRETIEQQQAKVMHVIFKE